MAWKPAEGKQTSRPHFCFNVTSQWHAAGWKEWGRGGNTYTFTLRAISEADSSPPAKHRQSALVLACSYRCQENQAQFYNLDRKTWYECLCCSEAGLYSFVKIIIIRCQFCSLTEKKEQSYELQTLTYYVHLNVFHLSCIFFAHSLNKHYFSSFNYEICGFFKKRKKKRGGGLPLCVRHPGFLLVCGVWSYQIPSFHNMTRLRGKAV